MTPNPPEAPESGARYDELIAREAEHWSAVDHDPANPQLWDDPTLYRLALEAPYRQLVDRAAASGGPLLELGCGEGELALELAGRGLEVKGVDLSPARIERARDAAGRAGLASRASFEVADLNAIALPHGAFRTIVAHDALHHVLRVEELLDAARDALVPGGRLVMSDFRGAGWLEKLASAALVAVLPSRLSYAEKWRRRARLRALLASERSKREAYARGASGDLHDASPFESISQASIVPAVAARFEIVEAFTFCPYWYHAVPKLRIPAAWQHALIGAFRRLDEPLNRRGWTRGSYVFLEARTP